VRKQMTHSNQRWGCHQAGGGEVGRKRVTIIQLESAAFHQRHGLAAANGFVSEANRKTVSNAAGTPGDVSAQFRTCRIMRA
jgi:hypothetical protein